VSDRTGVVVAIVNTNDDLVQALRAALEEAHYAVVTCHIRDIKAGKVDFGAFLSTHDPAVVVYDITVPYEDNWTFFQTLRKLPEAQPREFVITTVNKRELDRRVGPTKAIEIVGGHAQDFEPTLDAVNKAAGG
jgi:DNA-binding response OmpR family regulator